MDFTKFVFLDTLMEKASQRQIHNINKNNGII